MPKVRFSDECSPSKVPVRSPGANGNSTSTKDLPGRIELDNKAIQADSPLRMIELKEKSVPGIGSLYGNDVPGTRAPARTLTYGTDSKKKTIQATEEDRSMRKEAPENTANRFGWKGNSIQGEQSKRRIESKTKSIRDVEPIRTVEPVNSSFGPLSPKRRFKPANTSIPIVSPPRRSNSEDTVVSTSPIRKGKLANIVIPTKSPPRRSNSEDTVVSTPVQSCGPSEETIPQTPGNTRRQSKDNVSPVLRKMRSAISILSPFPLGVFRKLSPQATSLLRATCFFESTNIRQRYLETICELYYDLGKPVLEATLSDFPKKIELQSTLNELKQEQLITSTADSLGICIKDEVRQEVLLQLQHRPKIFAVGFETIVLALLKLWPTMIGPYRDLRLHEVATQESQPDFDQYARYGLWGGRDDLLKHVVALEDLFNEVEGATRRHYAKHYATGRHVALLVEVAWYYFERARYPEATQFIDAAFEIAQFGAWIAGSLCANLHRTSAAIAFELGDFARVNLDIEQFMLIYPDSFPRPRADAVRTWRRGCPTADWTWTDNAILQSGLLAAAPDGVGTSPWGFDEVKGFLNLEPYLSLRHFGWMNYAEGRYVDAAKCFLQCLGDRKTVFGHDDHVGPRTGELLYALGVVYKAQNKNEESLRCFERALKIFQKADEDGPGKAKAHYKIALHHIEKEELLLADNHLEQAADFYMSNGINDEYVPQLARVCLRTAQIAFMARDPVAFEALEKAHEHLEKVSPEHRGRQVSPKEAMFDAEVVIWDR